MSIRLICVCGRPMALPEKYAGQHVQCPDCHAMLRIPSPRENQSLTRWICPCGQRLKARPRAGGRKLRCPKCSAEVSVPFPNGHSAFIEENFVLDDESGIVQRVPEKPEKPREDAQPAQKPAPPPEPVPVLEDDDDDMTRINPKGPNFLGEMGRALAKRKAGETYELAKPPSAAPAPARPQPVRPAKPAAKTPVKKPPPAAPAQPIEEEASAQEVEDEGIRAPVLLAYFNATTGVEAAKAGAFQVLHGYWLYIPFALLAGCVFSLAQLDVKANEGNLLAAILWLVPLALCGLFLLAGFVACVKDGIFERSMGIERMLCNAGAHCLRFAGTALLTAPIGVGLAMAGMAIIAGVWDNAHVVVKIAIVALTPVAGFFLLELLLMPPVIAVLEHRKPFSSLGRGLLFSLRHAWDLFTITVVSMFVGWGIAGGTYLIWRLCKAMLRYALQTWNFELQKQSWLFESLEQFFSGLVSAAIVGQLAASLMLLYLSHVGDEERLRQIKGRLCGPAAVPWRLCAAIGIAAIALLALNYFQIPPAQP